MGNNHKLEAVIDRFEGEYAVIKIIDGQEILWPATELPEGVKESSVVNIYLTTNEELTSQRQSKAKDILNEIFSAE